MQIWIHDKSMRKVCALNNNVPGMLPYSNSQWHTYLEYSTSTLDFTIPKIVNGKLHDDLKYINDQMYVSFYYDNSYHVFYVSQLIENDFSFQVTCNNTNLELSAEIERPLASVDGAKTLEWYLQTLDLLGFAGLEVGFNEIPDRTRTITFESQNGTKLEQLHSLMNQFDAEFVFRTDLNRDGTLKKFVIDIYQRPDGNHHGIGKVRGDVVLYYQSGLKGVQVSSDKTQLFNAGLFLGKDGLTLGSVVFEEKNELGQVEFYSFKDSPMVYAPLSADKYPSAMGGANEIDRWTRRDFQTEYSDVDSLKAYALRTIKQYAYPLMTYTVSVQSSFIENYKDINLGDTVKIIDNNFRGGLALEARVSEMIISFDNPTNNSVVFTNFRKLDNKPSSELQQRIDEIVSKSLPYHVEIRTTNGTVFKNGIGRSTVKPILKQGDKIVDATYRFVIDGTIKYSGMTYDMVASEITQPTTLTIAAWVDNKEVASEEITFLNVSDGKQGPKGPQGPQGPKGDRGNDGIAGKDGVGLKTTTIIYGISDSDTAMPTNWTSQPPALIKGKYLWTKTVWTYTDSSSETGYQKTYIAKDGNDGNDGLPGKDGVGLVNTKIEYLKHTDGQIAPNPKYYSSFNWKGLTLSQYLEHDYVNDLTLIKSGKPVKYTDLKVGELVIDRTGEIFPIKEIFGTEGDSSNPGYINLKPSIGKWSKDIPTVNPGEYLWTRTTWFYSDGTNEQGFSVAKMGEQGPKGDRGNDGLPGKDGVGLKSTTITYGMSDSDTVVPTSWTANPPTLIKGKYLWTKTVWTYTDSSSETGYQKTYIAKDGNNGNDGLPGKDGVGIVNTTLRYAKSTDGVNKPSGVVVANFPNEIKPNLSSIDNNINTDLKVRLEQGKTYILSAETNGTFTNQHNPDQQSDNATIWLVNPSFSTWAVISDSNTANGTKYTHTRPTGDYKIRVNSYTPDNSTWVKNIVFEDGTWSPDIPVVNHGEFLWTRTTWFYSDGTSEQGFSVAKMGEQGPKGDRGEQGPKGDQGIPGPKGADGRTQYIHIAYADTVSGSGFSQTDTNKAYIGMYQDFNAEDSKNPQDYRWSKWKGSDGKDGIPGKAGADGRTPYVHFAYADSADGQTGFSLTQTGSKRYLGVLTNFFKEDSTNPSDYTWNDTAGSVSVGGENLIINSAFPKNLDNWGFWETGLPNENLHIATHDFYYNDTKNLFRLDSDGKGVPASSRRFPVKRNTDYSLNIQTFATGNIKGLTIYFLGRKANETDKTFTKVVHVKTYSGSPSVTQAVKWHLIFNSGDCDEGYIRIDNNGTTDGKTSMLFFAELDCYEGTTDRAWQASTKDLEEEMGTKADAAMTIEQINALNERAAIIKAEMEAKASAEILNNWIKNYQDFVKANETERAAAEKALVSSSQRVSTIAKDLGELSDRWNFIDTYMSSSNDGLVIGKNDGSSSIMFNPNGRISMYSAGSEVMYISQGVIHIENGIFSKTIQVGRYREEQYHLNPDMNVIRYVGGF
ncbi:host range and adsorption protein [Streptococcus phage CHPC1036]|uniref:Capsid and scaffold protein n=1 Tax=Streptococcus phage CHPC1036 TaxID=2365012 RepID=A0A3G8F9B3_9CAUD|nr:host range and adsorption protein [Streptococcus phage CHPC1036]AZF91381.1 capsid and scaffold protein [Streptococcus phage CHPC1036]